MFLTKFCLRNPVAVTLLYALVLLLGFVAFLRMGRSILPPVSIPVVTIAAPYPGAGPREIERLIIEPIEDQLDDVPDVERVSAAAQDGIAQITVRFRFGTNLDVDRSNVQQAVDNARPNMPADLVPPSVSKDDPAQAPVLEEAINSVVLSPAELSEIVNRGIVPELRATTGVGSVRIAGTLTRQFTIRPATAALNALGATSLDVLRAVSSGNDVLPGGTLKSVVQETRIGIRAAAASKEELENLPVAFAPGTSVRLRDVTSVHDTYADPSIVSRVDGESAVILYVSHAQGADSLHAIRAARRTLARLASSYPLVRFEQLHTDEPYTAAAVNGVLQTLGEGVILTVLVMLFFLHAWRNALICAIAIPSSLGAAFATMWALGFTLNVLSLMGLSLSIGILVDDSIVIIEAIARNASRGLSSEEAALAGRLELGGAAFAITLVDVAVFLPIALMSGLVGEFMREFGLVIVFATAFSLLVSFTLTPLLAARWSFAHRAQSLENLSFGEILAQLKARARLFPWTFRATCVLQVYAAWHALLNAFNASESRLGDRYASVWLPAALRHRRVVVYVAIFVCALSLVPLFSNAIATEFSPPTNRGEVTVDLTLPAGAPLARTDAAALRLTQALLQDVRVKHVESSAGRAFNGTADVFGSNLAELQIVLNDSSATGDDIVERVKALQDLVPDASIAGAGKGMGGAAPITYTISGDASTLDRAAQRLAAQLRANPYATDVRTTDAGLAPRMQIDVDEQRARLLNVPNDDVAQTARIASGGSIAMKARLPLGLVDVVVQSDAAQTGSLDAIKGLAVRSADAKLVPLGDLVSITRMQEPAVIEREDHRRVVTVSANTIGGAPVGLVTSRITLPSDAHIEPRGDLEQFLDTMQKMTAALGLSVITVYAILAILYRSYTLPLVIMLTVPFASIGALGSLFVAQQPLNLYSMLGIVMLVGLVAKNGILLVDYAERSVRQGVNAAQAMQRAARRRFRPIVMTTLAMIAGMLPLALGHTIGAEYRKALGDVVIGGLSSSLLLTLFIVPIVYVAYRTSRADRMALATGQTLVRRA